jgi:small-conductance mechanosensitive channel
VSWVVILTIIGVIIIFVEVGGYSDVDELPGKAHPILGIIIFICILIIPLVALIRPHEDHNCRPVWNWFYWLFTTIANVLAIPQMFIGMDFGKVMVPWWATWSMVIWVIFHLVCELTLEIHQCCTYKKNKERRKKWEQLKREYPKQHHPEPEPAGRRFKRFLLFLHVGFTIPITLIMIIIIAAA